MNRIASLVRAFCLLALLAPIFGPAVPAFAKGKIASPTAPAFTPEEQDALLKAEVLEFLKKNPDRKAGEGYLYLARHYRELDQADRALPFLQSIVRSDPVEAELKAEAQLLLAEILLDRKDYDPCLKELDRLISWNPERTFLVRAKIARAKLLGRGLTRIDDLHKAYKRYFERFPEKPEDEELRYLMGFERGYDLEIGMKGLTAWEEIQAFPEREAADLAKLHIALYYSFDLNKPDRGQEWLAKIGNASPTASAIDRWFVEAALNQFHLTQPDLPLAVSGYRDYLARTKNLNGWRVAHLALGSMLRDRLDDPTAAIEVFADLASIPPHLIATPSVSLKKRTEAEGEDRWWTILAYKMAGYTAEDRLHDYDRARSFYEKASSEHKAMTDKLGGDPDPWIRSSLERVEPKITPAQRVFDQAYEKYRSRDLQAAMKGFESFIAANPGHAMEREALYRMAVMVDNDFKQYDRALELYQKYVTLGGSPRKSAWNLDKLYDWGRLDEVRYRIGNLKALHQRDPVGAIDSFKELLDLYPDSYWAMQGLKDTIRLQKEALGDENASQESMRTYVRRYPDDKGSQDYRKILFDRLLAQNMTAEALDLLREYLDRSEPSEKGYLEYKKKWRDLSFRLRESEIRDRLKTAGEQDRQALYVELASVLSLASSSAPLKGFLAELEEADLPDEQRWGLGYRIGCELYREFPNQTKEVFEKLAVSASGPARLACALTLGNLAYRVDKSAAEALKWYQMAAGLTTPLDPLIETPTYRIARLTLQQGDGILALERLTTFIRRFPRSRHLAKAYFALGEAYAALHHPQPAKRFFQRAGRLSPVLANKIVDKMEQLAKADEPGAWLLKQAQARSARRDQEKKLLDMRDRLAAEGVTGSAAAALGLPELFSEPGRFTDDRREPASGAGQIGSESLAILVRLPLEDLETRLTQAESQPEPDVERIATVLLALIRHSAIDAPKRDRAIRKYISWRIFRKPTPALFTKEVQALLTEKNYPEPLSDLLFRMAQAHDRLLNEFEEANKAYFEYLSFFPDGKRVLAVRERIPQVYDAAKDEKNALRFYQKLIDDNKVPDETRVDASLRKAKVEERSEKSEEATKTLSAALAFESKRKPEIYLELERLTDTFDYVQQALDAPGDEEPRFKALRRTVKKAEEDKDYDLALKTARRYRMSFSLPESVIWIDKKIQDLGKRGAIAEIETAIEQFPEDPKTPARLFQLGQMIEGVENTKYRAQDLFYEITLVYPTSQFFKESKIRAENTRAIKAIDELGTLLKKGVKEGEGDELLLERARLYRDALQDPTHAQEDYEALLKLFPGSPRRDEAFLGLGEIALSRDHDGEKAAALWETGLSVTRDPKYRALLMERLDGLKKFRERVIFSEKKDQQQEGETQIYRLWRVERDREFAIGLLQEALARLENAPRQARLYYLTGRLYEELGRDNEALPYYDRALRAFYHPGLRRDRVLYRMARIVKRQEKKTAATELFTALVQRYPKSRYSRSGLYWLYKVNLEEKKLAEAHHYLSRLVEFPSLVSTHRKALQKKLDDLSARLDLAQMKRLQELSRDGGATFNYYVGKVLENDLRDYDRAIAAYEEYLRSNPPTARARDILIRMADLAERKGEYVRSIGYLDSLRTSLEPSGENLGLIVRIGNMVEERLGNPELAKLFYETVEEEYDLVPTVRDYARGKLKRLEEKLMAKAEKPKAGRKVKREYTDEDQEILDAIDEIQKRDIDDLQDYAKAEKALNTLWDENKESPATLEIMKLLVEINEGALMDPQKAAEYYERWLAENPGDPELPEYTMKLYDLYMEKVRDGQKALRLLETFVRENPTSNMIMDAQLKLAKANEQLVMNFDEARRAYQRLIDTRQNNITVHEAYFRMGFVLRDGFADYTGAVKYWEEMNQLFYNNTFSADAQFAIGYTYEAFQRDYTKAREAYEKLLQLFPNSPLQNQTREALLRISGKQ